LAEDSPKLKSKRSSTATQPLKKTQIHEEFLFYSGNYYWRTFVPRQLALHLNIPSLIKMKETSPTKLEVWTENLRKALWQSNPKMTIRQHPPQSTDKTETRFFFPNTPTKKP